MLLTLTAQDVLSIHDVLAADFAAASDPISPSGVKSQHLLESAVSRQFTGYDGKLKYDTPSSNAASLTYGICCNHPFHNGNKRTALVAMLCHMDRNDLTFQQDVTHDALYAFMLKVAAHGFAPKGKRGNHSDFEVDEMTHWIRKRVRKVERGERVVTFRELRSILQRYDLQLEDLRNNSVDLVKYEDRTSWFGLKKQRERIRLMRMAWPGEGQMVGRSLLKEIRERSGLTDRHGVDSHNFYAKERPTDFFVQTYRGLLRRLARV